MIDAAYLRLGHRLSFLENDPCICLLAVWRGLRAMVGVERVGIFRQKISQVQSPPQLMLGSELFVCKAVQNLSQSHIVFAQLGEKRWGQFMLKY